MANSGSHRYLNTPKKALFHGLRNAMQVIFSGREALTTETNEAVRREILKDMEVAEGKARGCLEALAKLV